MATRQNNRKNSIKSKSYIYGRTRVDVSYPNASIVLQRIPKALSIPEACLEFSGDSTFVYQLDSKEGQEQYFTRKQVKTGLSDGIYIEVKDGVKAGDKIRGIAKENN